MFIPDYHRDGVHRSFCIDMYKLLLILIRRMLFFGNVDHLFFPISQLLLDHQHMTKELNLLNKSNQNDCMDPTFILSFHS